MSEIKLNLLAAERTVHGRLHRGEADRIVAALAADPRTIDEVALALGRYRRLDEEEQVFSLFDDGLDEQPGDAGILFIDLVGRVIASESTASSAGRQGTVDWHDGRCETDVPLSYCLAADWLILSRVDDFAVRSRERRAQLPEPTDERAVLYGRLAEFILRELHARQSDLKRLNDDGKRQLVREIHARWMMTPRDDLGGRTPRAVMIDARHEQVDRDLGSQQERWSRLRAAPPGIPRDSHAYRLGGFGTHELVLYYELARELLWESLARFHSRHIGEAELPGEAEHLQRYRQDWLNGPDPEYCGRTPASIIDRERRRLPEGASPGEAIADHECPACRMLRDEESGPAFWGLDGCDIDDDFEFSFHRTREEWEEERRQWEEFHREWEQKRQREQAFLRGELRAEEFLEATEEESRIWRTSFSDQELIDGLPFSRALPILLFGIAGHLSELCEELSSTPEGSERARSLRSHFMECRESLSLSPLPGAESVLALLAEELRDVSSLYPVLGPRCADLQGELDRLLARCRAEPDDDLPF